MSKLRINSPGNGGTVSTKCPVSGDCDLGEGTVVNCTISKDGFLRRETTTVDASGNWSIKLGDRTPIPVGNGYEIKVSTTAEQRAVDGITVSQNA